MFTDQEAAQRIYEQRKAAFQSYARTARKLGHSEPTWLEAGSCFAVYAGDSSLLTQAYWLGYREYDRAHLDAVRQFFAGRSRRWELILSTYCSPEAWNDAVAAGGRVEQFENVYLGKLADLELGPEADVDIRVVESEPDVVLWNDVSARGFFGENESPYVVEMGRLMMALEGITRYIAFVDGIPAAAATLSMRGPAGALGGAATLPEFRGRGLQSALIRRRLADLKGRTEYVMMEAMPGSASARNAERAGLRLALAMTSLVFEDS